MLNLPDPSEYILLAEDNSADVELVREALEGGAIACELQVIEDGERAIDFIQRIDRDSTLRCPKLLLLDLHLPKRDGEEVLQCLRASERCGQTPVVILTSSDSPSDKETATRNAAIHYFRKPHVIVENQVALGDKYPVKSVLSRLIAEGLDRHEAVHAIGSALTGQFFDAGKQKSSGTDLNAQYLDELNRLTAAGWRKRWS